jgi:hypothetical protein
MAKNLRGMPHSAEFWLLRFGHTTFLKREYPPKLFHSEISSYHILTLKKLHLRFQRGHWPRWNRFWRLSKRLSWRIRSHMQNGFSPWIRALGGVDWRKKTEGWQSRATVPLTWRPKISYCMYCTAVSTHTHSTVVQWAAVQYGLWLGHNGQAADYILYSIYSEWDINGFPRLSLSKYTLLKYEL